MERVLAAVGGGASPADFTASSVSTAAACGNGQCTLPSTGGGSAGSTTNVGAIVGGVVGGVAALAIFVVAVVFYRRHAAKRAQPAVERSNGDDTSTPGAPEPAGQQALPALAPEAPASA